MKLIYLFLSGFLTVVILMYLAVAFTNWEFNPSLWSKEARSAVAFFGIFIGFFAGAISVAFYEDHSPRF